MPTNDNIIDRFWTLLNQMESRKKHWSLTLVPPSGSRKEPKFVWLRIDANKHQAVYDQTVCFSAMTEMLIVPDDVLSFGHGPRIKKEYTTYVVSEKGKEFMAEMLHLAQEGYNVDISRELSPS